MKEEKKFHRPQRHKLFVDYANEKEVVYLELENDEIYRCTPIGFKKVALASREIYSEPIPMNRAKPLLEKGVKFYRCRTTATSELRDKLGLEKSDENDALVIRELYKRDPGNFREWTGESRLGALYAIYKQTQKEKVAVGNRDYALGGDEIISDIKKRQDSILTVIEKKMKEELDKYVVTPWLLSIKGLSVVTAAGIVFWTEKIGIENFGNPSKLKKYFGLHVKDGKSVRGGDVYGTDQKLDFPVMARALMIGVVADLFVKQRSPVYRKIYDRHKAEQTERVFEPGFLMKEFNGRGPRVKGRANRYGPEDTRLGAAHANNRAMRKMMQIFLIHLWVIWRQLLGLPTPLGYAENHLKHRFPPLPPNVPKELEPFEWVKE